MLKEMNTWFENLRNQYMDLSKLILNSMTLLPLLDLKRMLLICIYMKVSGRKFIILIIYVDDILPATNDLGLLHETKIFFSKNLEMKDTGEASYLS